MKRLAAALVAIWILLWGDFSLANVLTGTAAAITVLVAFPGERDDGAHHVLRPGSFVRLAGYLLKQLVRSNLLLAREVLSRTSRLRTAVIAMELKTKSPALITATTNLMALNPGTIVIELDERAGVVYVHVFYLNDVDEIRRDAERLQELVIESFTPRQASSLDRTPVRS
ncbi:MAG TPA: Na+/H+ antiporter subunit E [Acidimicrobiales bacterium]